MISLTASKYTVLEYYISEVNETILDLKCNLIFRNYNLSTVYEIWRKWQKKLLNYLQICQENLIGCII